MTPAGEENLSFGYGGTGKASTNSEFKDYGEKFSEGDVVGVYLDLDAEPATISYAKNGVDLGTCFEFEKSSLGEQALYPHVLSKNCEFTVNFGQMVCVQTVMFCRAQQLCIAYNRHNAP